jgi:2-keto-4-pentenoate hydratase
VHFRSAPPRGENDPAAILACIDWIAHGIEIVQSHYPGWKFQAADTIADWALHGTLLVGEQHAVGRFGPRLVSQLERFGITYRATVTCATGGAVRTYSAAPWPPSRT